MGNMGNMGDMGDMGDMECPSVRLLLLSAIGAWLVVAGCKSSERKGNEDETNLSSATVTGTAESAEVAPLVRVAWWNDQEVVNNLGLTPAQRKVMDELLTAHMKQRALLRQPQPGDPSTLWELLIKGSREDAEAAANDMMLRSMEPRRHMLELKIGVLFAMTDTQRQKFGTSYPHLIRRPWVVGGDGGRRRSRPPSTDSIETH
ncbi:MAG: hypothetical protein A2289_16345 [Deltaproteobacteria bacterium RIFOXYA12_FULL_58_15]|nr:MAG: hypothetical protein A2289_16345 [Deltaproteobacteria bacterium RIFOXYA12_FULL_58_15]OGR13200.1 MAG: hypothetical protein A2341_15300 [Deltaproteobacteria bacterium RIFOXYB12_FULL_58_9]